MALYNVEFIHKVSSRHLTASKPIELNPTAFEDKKALGAALRRARVVGVEYPGQDRVLMKGESVKSKLPYEKDGKVTQIVVFPRTGIWHSITFTPVETATATIEPASARPATPAPRLQLQLVHSAPEAEASKAAPEEPWITGDVEGPKEPIRPTPPNRSWGAEVIADNSGRWCGNGIRLGTKQEAEAYASDLFMRWTLVKEWRVVESTDPVNRQFHYYGGLMAVAARAAVEG